MRNVGQISVGQNAAKDVILARASLDSARILFDASKVQRSARPGLVARKLGRLGPSAYPVYLKTLSRLEAKGWPRNQAVFDALRLTISDNYAAQGAKAIREAARSAGLGDDTGRQVGCAITGGVTAIGGSILSMYTGGIGGSAMSVGGQLVGGALDCNRDAREAQQATAAAQAREAQALAEQARLQAEALERAAAHRSSQVRTVAIAGGGVALLLGLGWLAFG